MKQYVFLIISFLTISLVSSAQDYNDISDNGTFATENTKRDKKFGISDSIQSQHKEVPRGILSLPQD